MRDEVPHLEPRRPKRHMHNCTSIRLLSSLQGGMVYGVGQHLWGAVVRGPVAHLGYPYRRKPNGFGLGSASLEDSRPKAASHVESRLLRSPALTPSPTVASDDFQTITGFCVPVSVFSRYHLIPRHSPHRMATGSTLGTLERSQRLVTVPVRPSDLKGLSERVTARANGRRIELCFNGHPRP